MIYARVIKILHVYEIEKKFRISFACGSHTIFYFLLGFVTVIILPHLV